MSINYVPFTIGLSLVLPEITGAAPDTPPAVQNA